MATQPTSQSAVSKSQKPAKKPQGLGQQWTFIVFMVIIVLGLLIVATLLIGLPIWFFSR